MNFWIFKVSEASVYPDLPGEKYVYDNRHSVRVEKGDEFIYLEKLRTYYRLTGAGHVLRVEKRAARLDEQHSAKVASVFTAHLSDVVWFKKPFDLSMLRKAGRWNRQRVGLPNDLNSIGWSLSMPRIEREIFLRLLDAAIESGLRKEADVDSNDEANWRVEDSWSVVRKRCRMQAFRTAVLMRHNHTCAVCGTRLRAVLDAAHIRSYAADPDHRANPANGICLCAFCHAAYDGGELLILPDGRVQYPQDLCDEIALNHFTAVTADQRCKWIRGVDPELLLGRLEAASHSSVVPTSNSMDS